MNKLCESYMPDTGEIHNKKKANRKVALNVGQKRIAFSQEVRMQIDISRLFTQVIPVSSEPKQLYIIINLYENQWM